MLRLLLIFVLVAGCVASAQEPATSSARQTADAPLPPMRELLLELDRNEKAVEARARDYTYHVHLEQQDLDGKGNG